MDWIDLAQDTDRRRAVVNAVFIQWREFLGWLRTWYLIKKNFAPLDYLVSWLIGYIVT